MNTFKDLTVLKLFFEEPTREFNVRELARIIKISPATASKQLKSLAKKGLVKERKERFLNLYKANLESEFYRDFKIFYNLRKIKDSGLLDALNKFYLKPTVVLFGSSAYGSDTETSDFDLLVISEKTEDFLRLKEFEKKLKRSIQIFVFKDVKSIKNEHLVNNILNGITVHGKIKWI